MTDYETIRRVHGLRNRQTSYRRNCCYLAVGFMIFGVVLTYNLLK